jgi:hypothetical protein
MNRAVRVLGPRLGHPWPHRGPSSTSDGPPMLGIAPIVYPSMRRGGPGGAGLRVIDQSRAMSATLPSKWTGDELSAVAMRTHCPMMGNDEAVVRSIRDGDAKSSLNEARTPRPLRRRSDIGSRPPSAQTRPHPPRWSPRTGAAEVGGNRRPARRRPPNRPLASGDLRWWRPSWSTAGLRPDCDRENAALDFAQSDGRSGRDRGRCRLLTRPLPDHRRQHFVGVPAPGRDRPGVGGCDISATGRTDTGSPPIRGGD